jgi:UDP-N-acetylmuramate dehydrogenase
LVHAEEEEFESSLRQHVSLAPMTTLGIGGPARYLADADSPASLSTAARWARERNLPLFVLGGGSNIVVADDGFPGLVVRIDIRGVQADGNGDRVMLTVGAGEEWDSLVSSCVSRGWAGFECLSGIPGRVGATPIQNVGAYGQDVSETLQSVDAFDLKTEQLLNLSAAECRFGYRSSRFKTDDRDRFVITRVMYALTAGGRPAVRYPELERDLAERGEGNRSLLAVRESVLTIRKRKAMVIDPLDGDSRSVGSFFVNPTLSRSEFEELKRCAEKHPDSSGEIPAFPIADNRIKVSAAWLIERAGISRGFVYANVGTSTKHALAIINRGGGTAREVIELKDRIQTRVRDRFGVELVPEPVFVGFEDPAGC